MSDLYAGDDQVKICSIIMAGGKGSRMGLNVEKPLIKIKGKFMILYVIDALRESQSISRIIVAVTKKVPETSKIIKQMGIEVLETPGLGFIEDLKYAIRTLRLHHVLVICADIPLITADIIDFIVDRYWRSGKPALAVYIPIHVYKRLCLVPEYKFKIRGVEVVPAGVNIIDGTKIDQPYLEEEHLILEDIRLAVNVNTQKALSIVKTLLEEV